MNYLESDGRVASSEVRRKTDFSSEVSRYSLLEWHLPKVMMNYFESDGRVASSEVRHACTPELNRSVIDEISPPPLARSRRNDMQKKTAARSIRSKT